MDLKKRKIFFKILMFLSAFLLGLSLIDLNFSTSRICISLSFFLTMIGSFYEWVVISKKIKEEKI